ncbi:MAG: ester cyclase [Chloroflexota bacterium]|nr:ester cyclase [Chloroflexota bacterium]
MASTSPRGRATDHDRFNHHEPARGHCAAVRRRSLHRWQRGTRPRLLHADIAWHGGALGTVTGVDNVAAVLGGFIGALSDIQATVQDAIASDDLVALRLVVTATHTGNLLGVPATGLPVRWDAVDIYRITDDGRISEQWAFEDLAAILSQVGAIALPWAG